MTRKDYRKLISSILIGTLLFPLMKPGFVQAVASDEDLSLFVTTDDVEVGTRVSNRGYRQIKYKYKDKEYLITDDSYTNADPETDGEYITWMAQIGSSWQVFLYHIISGETIQLTTTGNNVNPVISGNYVAWEGQVDGIWQIFVFDGIRIVQITSGDQVSQDVGISGDYVIFSTKDAEEEGWRIYLYDIGTSVTTNLTPDAFGYSPKITGNIAKWNIVVDKKAVYYVYDINTGETMLESEYEAREAAAREAQTGEVAVEAHDETPVVVVESTENGTPEEDLIDADATSPSPDEPNSPDGSITDSSQDVSESTRTEEPAESADVVEEPKVVTEEDIMQELGITAPSDTEETIPGDAGEIPEATLPEDEVTTAETVEESTASE